MVAHQYEGVGAFVHSCKGVCSLFLFYAIPQCRSPPPSLKFRFSNFKNTEDIRMYYDLRESGLRIKKLRKQKGLTQEQLADKLNISTSNLGKLERGRQGLSIDLLIELSIFSMCLWTTYCLVVSCRQMLSKDKFTVC